MTPLRADALRNRARVLEAAGSAFAAEGQSVSLDEIARRAGVGPGTVHRHFPTKEALFEAVILSRLEGLAAEAASLASAGDPGATFFGFFSRLVEEGGANMALHAALAGAGAEVGPATLEAGQRMERALGELLTRAQRAGQVRGDVSVGDLHALIAGSLAMERHRGGSGSPGRLTAIVRDGLRPRR